jgi:hypothetical protein
MLAPPLLFTLPSVALHLVLQWVVELHLQFLERSDDVRRHHRFRETVKPLVALFAEEEREEMRQLHL